MSSSGQCPRTPAVGARRARPNGGLFLRVPLRGHPHRPPCPRSFRRGVAVRAKMLECVRPGRRTPVTQQVPARFPGARMIRRARPTAAAISHGKSERVLRRTLRSPGAERSRLPYAAKPRGRTRPQAGTGGRRRTRSDGPVRRSRQLKKCPAKNQERDVEVDRKPVTSTSVATKGADALAGSKPSAAG